MIRHSRKEVKRQRQVPPDGSPSAQVPALHRERVPGVPGGHVAERGPADLVHAVRQRHLRVLDRLDAVGLGEREDDIGTPNLAERLRTPTPSMPWTQPETVLQASRYYLNTTTAL